MLSRRDFLVLAAAAAGVTGAQANDQPSADLHRQILEEASRLEARRRARFAAVTTPGQLSALQKELRDSFLALLDGLPPVKAAPPVRQLGQLDGGDFRLEKLVYESFPGYFVPALLYVPSKREGKLPGILSPCGHSAVGKAAPPYQTLHINLAKRGYVVLTYDPVGQGERSQFWDAERGRSRFNLTCGEHAVLGNPLYLLGTSLARYRIWDGMRGLDYLASRPEVDAERLACVGNSGGGTLTAYIAALDPRVRAAAICSYITTLPRRMANRIQEDPDADPEQDIFGFVSAGIDHAGLLALRSPRPTLLGTARLDFFPIEGARESFAEAKRLYELAGAGDSLQRVEAEQRHGLSQPIRQGVYDWFDRWLHPKENRPSTPEIAVKTRSPEELRVCADGQVNVTFRSRPLLSVAMEEFRARPRPPRVPVKELLRLDPKPEVVLTELTPPGQAGPVHVLCVNGVEAPDWRGETKFLQALAGRGMAVTVADPRGVGKQRPMLEVKGHAYDNPLCGVEENLAYNAFLVGKTLLGVRVADVLEAVARVTAKAKPERLIVCGRRDAALVACLAAALEPKITAVAVEEMLLSFWPLFEPQGQALNAASILPGLLRDFGDVESILEMIGPRKVLAAAPREKLARKLSHVTLQNPQFSQHAAGLLDWI